MGRSQSDASVLVHEPHDPQTVSRDDAADRWWRSREGAGVIVGLTAIIAVPLLVALVGMHQPRWLPVSDVAQLEMRVRDVAGGHPPQVGLAGRFLAYGEIGSHPGALVFYLLWPVYWLGGADGWGLLVATAVLVLAGTGLSIWVGYRRGGWPLAVLVAAMLALLLRAHGTDVLVAWTPYLVIVWWVVFLLALWAVLCRDVVALPLAVFAGSLCMQTHVAYLGLVGGAVALAAVWGAGGGALRRRRRTVGQSGSALPSPAGPPGRRWAVWAGASAVLGVLLWLPPLIEQATNDPGNFTILLESFRNPHEDRVGFSLAAQSWAVHLNPVDMVRANLAPLVFTESTLRSVVPGLVFLAVWAGTGLMVWRRREAMPAGLPELHIVAGVATLLGLLATARIHGPLFGYLLLFGWGTTALMLLAVFWSALAWLPLHRLNPARVMVGAGALVLLGLFGFEVAGGELSDGPVPRKLAVLAEATLDRLEEDPAGCSDDCSYVVTWDDPRHAGSEGFGLLVELERQDIDARATPGLAPAVRSHRVMDAAEADAVIHVAVTDARIDEARSRPGAEELAYVDPSASDDAVAANEEADYPPSAVFLIPAESTAGT
jgi:hypothetical protein